MEIPLEHLVKPTNVNIVFGKKGRGMSHSMEWLAWFDKKKESP